MSYWTLSLSDKVLRNATGVFFVFRYLDTSARGCGNSMTGLEGIVLLYWMGLLYWDSRQVRWSSAGFIHINSTYYNINYWIAKYCQCIETPCMRNCTTIWNSGGGVLSETPTLQNSILFKLCF